MPKLNGRWRSASIVVGVLAMVTVATYLLLHLADDPAALLDGGDKLASIGALVLGAAVALNGWWSGRLPPSFEQGRLLADAEQELAHSVARQWEEEAAVRGLIGPAPLRIRWASTDRSVAAPAAEVLGEAWTAGRTTRLKLQGTVEDVAFVLRQLPAHQLVMIGPPGAGKTSAAVILARTLLRTREPDEPTPVLLSLSTWEPHSQSLESWLTQAIARQYPLVTDAARFGPGAVTRLLRAGRILPILDGLDEVPDGARGRAVTGLNNYLTVLHPVVLTCRSTEYQQVIGQVGSPLARAAVVELAEVSGAEAADYLPAGQGEEGTRRWSSIVRHLRQCPDGVLARGLSTPLMVHLARTAYRAPGTDPAQLLRFADREELEEHLLAAYVPAVYTPRPDSDVMPRYGLADSQKWLSFLARHMTDAGTNEIAWWRLVNAVPHRRALDVLASTILVASIIFTVTTMASTASYGRLAAMIVGPFIGLPLGLVSGLAEGLPHRVRIAPRKLVDGFAVGAGMTLSVLPLVLLLALLLLDEDLATELGYAIVVQAALCLAVGTLAGAVALLVEGLSGPAVDDHLADHRMLLRRDRQALLITTVVATLASGLIMAAGCLLVGILSNQLVAVRGTLTVSAAFALILGPILGMAAGAGSAWLRFQQARAWLSPSGRIPWRVVDFLDDAHRRGVLRKVGPEYQFRHARLQEFFAGTWPVGRLGGAVTTSS